MGLSKIFDFDKYPQCQVSELAMKTLLLHVLFLAIALLVAFAVVPLEKMYFDGIPAEEIKQYYQDALAFKSGNAWKIVFTWFLGLSCGRLMLLALKNNSQTTKNIKQNNTKIR